MYKICNYDIAFQIGILAGFNIVEKNNHNIVHRGRRLKMIGQI
jgi:hypothetical protein